MKVQFNYSDANYRDATNYEHSFYNFPVTVEIDGMKYILPFGSSDVLSYQKVNDEMLYIVAENSGLDYIGLVLIDADNGNIDQDVYIDSVYEMEFTKNIFDLDTDKQIEILSNWFE